METGQIRHDHLKELIEIVKDLNNRNVEFQSITENIDTTTPGGKLIFHIFGALAEFERDIIRERTNAGLQAARARGDLAADQKQKPQYPKESSDSAIAL